MMELRRAVQLVLIDLYESERTNGLHPRVCWLEERPSDGIRALYIVFSDGRRENLIWGPEDTEPRFEMRRIPSVMDRADRLIRKDESLPGG